LVTRLDNGGTDVRFQKGRKVSEKKRKSERGKGIERKQESCQKFLVRGENQKGQKETNTEEEGELRRGR